MMTFAIDNLFGRLLLFSICMYCMCSVLHTDTFFCRQLFSESKRTKNQRREKYAYLRLSFFSSAVLLTLLIDVCVCPLGMTRHDYFACDSSSIHACYTFLASKLKCPFLEIEKT